MARQKILVLSAGTDPRLLNTRNEVLRQAGYYVTAAYSSQELVEKLFGGDFDLVLMCHSIPAEEQETVTQLVHRYTPSTPVVVVTASDQYRAFADAQVPNDPVSLLKELPLVLAHKTR